MTAPAISALSFLDDPFRGRYPLTNVTGADVEAGDLFRGLRNGHLYEVDYTGAESGFGATDLTTDKSSSPWKYNKQIDVLWRKHTDEVLSERAWGVLVGVARVHGTITYTSFAAIFGLDNDNPQDRWRMGVILDAVGDRSMDEAAIALPVLVVGHNTSMPNGRRDPENPSGFYTWAVEKGMSIKNPEALVAKLMREVYTYFGA